MLHFLVLFLEIVFFIGLAGSMVVAIMAFVGDFSDFFEPDKPEGAATQAIGDWRDAVTLCPGAHG
jgi:hypothetical protein